MANPRKFSEKIALLNQKQAEGNAQFEQVMREVSDATKRPDVTLMPLDELKKGTPVPYHRDRDRVGPMRPGRSAERRVDKSPYSGPYLSPPAPDCPWRRTNSDSALHQSASGGLMAGAMPSPQHQFDVPINIYPSGHDSGSLQIPISNNTGSLPDLTSYQFSSPLHAPLDQEDSNLSPGGTCTVSPSGGRLHIQRVPSPLPHGYQQLPQALNRRRGYPVQGFTLGSLSPTQPGSEDGIFGHHHGHLYVPSLYNHSKVVKGEVVSPTSTSPGQQDGTLSSQNYRPSQPARPSPQNSPGLTATYRSQSPHSPHSPHSAPASPLPFSPGSSPTPNQSHFPDSYSNYVTQTQLQQHFEQFNMMDTPTSASLTYIPTSNTNSEVLSPEDGGVPDGGYYSTSPSQMQFVKTGSTQHTSPNTPNTPSSIPDIIVADFSEGPTETKNEMMGLEDLFPSDETLREGLGAIDYAGFQMLTDPGMLFTSGDPTAEDKFPLDRFDQ